MKPDARQPSLWCFQTFNIYKMVRKVPVIGEVHKYLRVKKDKYSTRNMMTSLHGNSVLITGVLWGESNGQRKILVSTVEIIFLLLSLKKLLDQQEIS